MELAFPSVPSAWLARGCRKKARPLRHPTTQLKVEKTNQLWCFPANMCHAWQKCMKNGPFVLLLGMWMGYDGMQQTRNQRPLARRPGLAVNHDGQKQPSSWSALPALPNGHGYAWVKISYSNNQMVKTKHIITNICGPISLKF